VGHSWGVLRCSPGDIARRGVLDARAGGTIGLSNEKGRVRVFLCSESKRTIEKSELGRLGCGGMVNRLRVGLSCKGGVGGGGGGGVKKRGQRARQATIAEKLKTLGSKKHRGTVFVLYASSV